MDHISLVRAPVGVQFAGRVYSGVSCFSVDIHAFQGKVELDDVPGLYRLWYWVHVFHGVDPEQGFPAGASPSLVYLALAAQIVVERRLK